MTLEELATKDEKDITIEEALRCLIDDGCIPEFDSSYDEVDRAITYYLRCYTSGEIHFSVTQKEQFSSNSLLKCMIFAARKMVIRRIYKDNLT